jgi:hypothetical protein
MPARPLIPLDIIEDYVSFPQTKSQTNDQEVILRCSQWFCFSQSQEANGWLQPAVLRTKQWKWFLGVRFESGPANQPSHEELKPYRSCPGRSYDWPEPAPGDKKSTGCRYCPISQFLAQACTGRAKNDVRRAKIKNEERRPNQRLKSS